MMPPARANRQHSEARRFGEGIRTDSSVLVGSASPARAASQPPRGGVPRREAGGARGVAGGSESARVGPPRRQRVRPLSRHAR